MREISNHVYCKPSPVGPPQLRKAHKSVLKESLPTWPPPFLPRKRITNLPPGKRDFWFSFFFQHYKPTLKVKLQEKNCERSEEWEKAAKKVQNVGRWWSKSVKGDGPLLCPRSALLHHPSPSADCSVGQTAQREFSSTSVLLGLGACCIFFCTYLWSPSYSGEEVLFLHSLW